jgi:Gpi18-like mannosyltransferase
LGTAAIHELLWKIFWFINIKVPSFPSNFIFWWESVRGWYFINKLPAILADCGIIYLLYLFGKKLKNERVGFWAAAIFAFNPVFFYNSGLWGQTDSIYAFFMLLAFYLLFLQKSVQLSAVSYALSILTKPNPVFALPVFLFYWIKKINLRKVLISVLILVSLILLLYFPFHTQGTIPWVIDFYRRSLGGELNYLVANSFNLWSLFFGFDNRPDTVSFLGLPAYIAAYIFFAVFLVWLMAFLHKNKSKEGLTALFAGALLTFAAFLFLPRMHERYFYSVLVLLIPVVVLNKKLRNVYFALSFIHLVNLYHFWWVPRINFLINILSNVYVEKAFILANFACFFWLIRIFHKEYAKK